MKRIVYILATAFFSLIYSDLCFAGEMVVIPKGEFIMGANISPDDWEKPEHKIYLDSYEIDKYEVTVEEYLRCIKAKKCPSDIEDIKYFKFKEPMRQVNWYEADTYCKWVGKRLPTEAEWEKAARGPTGYVNPWGNREFQKNDGAIEGNFGDVGRFENDKSKYGVYDMAGNVSEWVADWYSDDYYKQSPYKNPTGPIRGEDRTVRGGNFLTNIKGDLQTSFFAITRYGLSPDAGPSNIGFRCAQSVSKRNE